ncbi:class I SAM-dependent methyltransferase [Aeromonas sp. MR7]|uniref:class I SAM-dependent methyltransferase n=1 Tax=Aeromonas TaxID=642 RepID=UPI001F4B135C|nr:class I SAM-dependent methyltransferase [Aeromonas sp. MR7]MCH7346696.1 class I SAM-dependent methyltransferase [Aeromonas sp. MR7]
MIKEKWETGIRSEIRFWTSWTDSQGGEWPCDFADRLNPFLPLQSIFVELCDKLQGNVINILDCGAGPLTIIGKQHPTKQVRISAIDALADEYQKLVFPSPPPILTEFCETERLLEKFDVNTFDISYARNTLDHSYNPLVCISNMISVTKVGGYIYLQHSQNEAEHENYIGMHQWNFCVKDADLFIWNKDEEFNVTKMFKDMIDIESISSDGVADVILIKR